MNLDQARATGLPVVVGGSADPDDARPDLIGPGVEIEAPALPEPPLNEEVVVVHGAPPSNEFPDPQPAAPAASLDAEVDALLARIADIETRLRAKMRLSEINAALDRVDALLK